MTGIFFLSRFAGVSEAAAEREHAGEIPSEAEGSVLGRFAGVTLSLSKGSPSGSRVLGRGVPNTARADRHHQAGVWRIDFYLPDHPLDASIAKCLMPKRTDRSNPSPIRPHLTQAKSTSRTEGRNAGLFL